MIAAVCVRLRGLLRRGRILRRIAAACRGLRRSRCGIAPRRIAAAACRNGRTVGKLLAALLLAHHCLPVGDVIHAEIAERQHERAEIAHDERIGLAAVHIHEVETCLIDELNEGKAHAADGQRFEIHLEERHHHRDHAVLETVLGDLAADIEAVDLVCRHGVAEGVIEICDFRHRDIAVGACQIDIEFQHGEAQVILHGAVLHGDGVSPLLARCAVFIYLL